MSEFTTASSARDELLQLRQEYLIPCTRPFYSDPPVIVGGQGSRLIDDVGHAYIDCVAGVCVMNAGHSEQTIIDAVVDQLQRLQHVTSIFVTEPVLRLAEKLAQISPSPIRRSMFCASGSEAVEASIMLALLHTRRRCIIACRDSLHGRTRLGVNLTGLPMWRLDPFPTDEIIHVPFGDIGALLGAMDARRGSIAAVIAEPVQGNGGVHVSTREWWSAARAATREHGALLIADEVQTAFNRTGRWFAVEHFDVVPDVLVLSKGLGNGLAIAAMMTTDELAASWTRPSASTHGGNPVSAAAALATIAFHESRSLGAHSAEMGERLRAAMRRLTDRYPRRFEAPRGLGLMLGMPVRSVPGLTSAAHCDAMLDALRHRGVLAGKSGASRDVLTLTPPLVISASEVDVVGAALLGAAEAIHEETRAHAT